MLTFAFVSSDTDGVSDEEELKDGDIYRYNNLDYLVKSGDRIHDESEFGNNTRIYVIGTQVIDHAFENIGNIGQVQLSSEVKAIGNYAFRNCDNMYFFYGYDVESIGKGAFSGSALISLTLYDTVTELGEDAFKDCRNLNRIEIYDSGVTEIRAGTFENCSLELIDLSNITHVDPDAFIASDLDMQVVRDGQTAKVLGMDEIVFDDPESRFFMYMENGVVGGVITNMVFLRVYSENTELYVEYSGGIGFSHLAQFTPMDGTDYRIETIPAKVVFPSDIGMERNVVEMSPGSQQYRMPDGTDLGDLGFRYWTVKGLDGEVTTISRSDFVDVRGVAEVVPVYGNAILTMDHSGVPEGQDASGLENAKYFTYNDTYPVLADLEDYFFSGWDVNGTVCAGGDRIETFTDHTAVSLWIPKVTYTLTYAGSDGTVVDTETHRGGASVHVNTTIRAPEEDHLEFVGWSLDGKTVIGPEDTVTMDADKVLKPVFAERKLLTVTYVSDSGTVGTGQCYSGREYSVDLEAESSDTRIFTGWALSDGTPVSVGSSITVEEDVKLTAQFRDREVYVVSFADLESGTLREGTMTEGLEFTIPTEVPRRDGWVFDCWTDGAGTTYSPGDTVIPDGKLSLTARWREPLTFTVTYEDGSSTEELPATEGTAHTVTSEIPASEGRFFVGWRSSDGTLLQPGGSFTVSSDTVLTAEWRDPMTFTVTYVLGDSAMTDSATEGENYTVTSEVPKSEGRFFVGWTGSGGSVDPGDVIEITGDTTLTAQWRDPAEYTVTYDLGNRTVTDTAYEGRPYTVDADAPVATGMEFMHWTMAGGGRVDPMDVLDVRGDVTLTAIWDVLERYTVTYTDGGYVIGTDTAYEGTPYTVGRAPAADEGERFTGWRDGDGTVHDAGDRIDVNGDTALSAVWETLQRHTVTFVSGTTVLGSVGCYEGSTVTADVDPGDRPGYGFAGWSLTSGGPVAYEHGDRFAPESEVTLHAVWIPVAEPEEPSTPTEPPEEPADQPGGAVVEGPEEDQEISQTGDDTDDGQQEGEPTVHGDTMDQDEETPAPGGQTGPGDQEEHPDDTDPEDPDGGPQSPGGDVVIGGQDEPHAGQDDGTDRDDAGVSVPPGSHDGPDEPEGPEDVDPSGPTEPEGPDDGQVGSGQDQMTDDQTGQTAGDEEVPSGDESPGTTDQGSDGPSDATPSAAGSADEGQRASTEMMLAVTAATIALVSAAMFMMLRRS